MEKILSLVNSMFQIYGRPLTGSAVVDFVASAIPKGCDLDLAEKTLRTWMSCCSVPPLPKDIMDALNTWMEPHSDEGVDAPNGRVQRTQGAT